MKVFGVLVLLATLSPAYGLRCYMCTLAKPNSCTEDITCPSRFDRCASVVIGDVVTRSCYSSAVCVSGITNCCSTDLCNGAITTGSSVLLLLVSSAITSLFL